MVDSHCHLADEAFATDLDAVIDRARMAGLRAALCILDATSAAERERAGRVARHWSTLRFAVGVHPHQAGRYRDHLDRVEEDVRQALADAPGRVAIGEVGLDYHYDFAPRELQQAVFRRQVALARETQQPIVIHTREADADTLAILREAGAGAVRGVFHCFTGGVELARQALDLGFHVSFSGIVTFKRADAIREAARIVPPERLLIETDAPYLAPTPHRGTRNEPAYVARVAEALAEVRGEPVDDVRRATTEAFERLFGAPA